MVSKYRKKKQQQKEWTVKNKNEEKCKACSRYTKNRQAVTDRARVRMYTDRTLRKQNAARVKSRLQMDTEYKQKNKVHASQNQKKRLLDTVYREAHRASMRQHRKTRLQSDAEYRKQHRETMRQHTKTRLQSDAEYRNQHRETMRQHRKTKLQSNAECRNQHRATMRQQMKIKLQRDVAYRDQHKLQMKIRLRNDTEYHDANKRRAYQHYQQVRCSQKYKQYRKTVMAKARCGRGCARENTNQQRKDKRLTDRQKYWLRRSRLLAVSNHRLKLLQLQKKMQSNTSAPLLDIKLLFNKTEQRLQRGRRMLTHCHSNLSTTANDCLQHMPADRSPTEEELTSAFNGIRVHTSCSEPYFWQQCYNVYMLTDAIAVDCTGKAHIFKPVTTKNSSEAADTDSQTASERRWECDPRLCHLPPESIDGVTALLRNIVSKNSSNCRQFYVHLDDCSNPAHDSRFGHSFFCCTDNGCQSLLRPARTLSPHFPSLRSLVRRLYEVRRLVLFMQSLTSAMHSGDYDRLKLSVESFDSLNLLSGGTNKSSSTDGSSHAADEHTVLQQFGEALRQVTTLRDTYVTSSCDICEQLRKDIAPLTSYADKQGYNSDRMREAIDLLYQHKTQEEDFEKFVDAFQICKYCAEKLRGNKEVARSFFNQLSVVPTPECIAVLNLFERTLIKFCVTCITVIRLGQVSNQFRPRNELTAALQGRIAYLPVDLQSNARFLPDNLLNVKSLVLLVGSQPTQQQRVWTGAVDLRKVHTALAWLQDNNPLYKDIPTYTLRDIEDIIAKQLDEQTEHTASDSALLKQLDEASKSHLYENFSVQPLSTDYPADVMVDYQMQKVHGQGTDIFDATLDLKAFPELFPTGDHGLKDSKRSVKIGTSEYIRSRLLHKNPKFRLNINYLFHSFQIQEVSNMCHSIGHMLRTVTGNNMSARAFLERLQQRDGEVQSKMFSMMANLRGSKEYFAKLGMDIKWMIKYLGPPTLFITCSTAEWFSQALIDHLKTINKDIPDIDRMTPAELCCMDPVTVSIHFQQKWNAIFTKLMKNGSTPVFGEVADHFWRIEYQARGAPHVHCLLWIKNAPILGQNSIQEVQTYINSISTCSMPDAETSPTLHQLVSQFQLHKCTKYCTKSYKRQGSFYKKCRFGFPRPVRAEVEVNDVIDCLAISRNKQPRKRLYNLPRTDCEQYVNDYNPALLLANQANVDVQYIGHLGSRLPYYVTDYITKHERSEQDAMWHDIFTSSKSLGSNAMSFLLKSIKSRQVGANEAADRLLGHKLHSKSRQLRFADLAPPDKAKRVLRPAADMKSMLDNNPDSCDIFQPHWVLDVYPDRPDELESCSLHQFLGWYEKQKSSNNKDVQLKLKTQDYTLRRRKDKPYIITHQCVNRHQSEENKELYFYYLLKLFKPWRMEANLCLSGTTYQESYLVEQSSLPEMKAYHEASVQVSQQDDQLQKAIAIRAEELRQAQEEGILAEDPGSALEGCRPDQMRNAMQDITDAHIRSIDKDSINSDNLTAAYHQLNDDQRRVVDKVVTAVCSNQEPLKLFVSGQGGTGKSKVIDVLNRLISHKMSDVSLPVVIAAPTGLAAFSIGGTTIHRVLSLPVEHGKPADYTRLHQEQLTLLKSTLKGVKLLIVDEVSMISSLTLLFIHMRLTELMSSSELFGGISVVFFGDFLQLPPVKGNQPFIPVTFLEAKQRFGAIASLDVWSEFEYEELTINMRQNSDRDYADLLSNLRIGQLTDQQYGLLQERLIKTGERATITDICDVHNQLVDEGKAPLILMPRTSLCNDINTAMLTRIGTDIHTFTAIDTLDTTVDKRVLHKVQQAYEKSDEDVTRTAGLEKHLQLCTGCKVMLKRNKNVDAGLVNGSVGTVVGFNSTQQDNRVHSVAVKFENIESVINIERDSASFEVLKSVYYTRKQFPLMLAFAITIHKSQGLSLQTAIVDAGTTNFGPGMVYVALSRVTSINGLHLIDLDRTKIGCDQKAIDEYNRLRQLYMPHLGNLSTASASHHSQEQKRNAGRKSQTTQRGRKNKTKKTQIAKPSVNNGSQQNTEQQKQSTGRKRHFQTISEESREDNTRKKLCAETRATNSKSTEAENMLTAGCDASVFNHCEINSVEDGFQAETCSRLNLHLYSPVKSAMTPSQAAVAEQLEQYIYKHTATRKTVHIHSISGDGNCLFRALSTAISHSQRQHNILRLYITNYMTQPDIAHKLKQLFGVSHKSQDEHSDHVMAMQERGQWGTDQEVATAAHLFQCSIICLCRYSNNKYCLQHFSPHFIEQTPCIATCKHPTVYIVNSCGNHFETATVANEKELEE